MAEFEDATPTVEKVPQNIYSFDTDNMSKLKSFLKSMHINFKSQSLENARLINEMTDLKNRNITKIYRVKEKNIGLLSKGRLEKRISDKTGKIKPKAPKRNMNGKQGIDRYTNYAYIRNAPRKTCFNCGNTNHLAIDCRKVKKKETAVSSSDIRSRLVNYKPQNPCFHCGNKWHSIFMCNEYHSLYHNDYEPFPKFHRKIDSNKTGNVSLKSTSINSNSETTKSDNLVINGFYWKKKTFAVHVNKLSRKRIQQVWIQKQSN